MADTIKKSRIVSVDEDLEETLLEEFNLRLKQCMDSADADAPYENVAVKLNGHAMDVTDHVVDHPPPLAPTEPSVKDRMLLATDDTAACLLFTQTVTSPMLTPSEENIDFLKGFRRDSDPPPTAHDGDGDALYENVATAPSPIYENVEVTAAGSAIYENVRVIDAKRQTVEFLANEVQAECAAACAPTPPPTAGAPSRDTPTQRDAIESKLREINSGMYVMDIMNGVADSQTPLLMSPDRCNTNGLDRVDQPEVMQLRDDGDESVRQQEDEQEQRVEVQPEMDEQQPEVNGDRPEMDAQQPEVNGNRPEVDENEPEVGGNEPEVAENEPEVSGIEPEVDKNEPEMAENEPEVAENEPEVAEIEPEVAEIEPEVDENEPEVDEDGSEIEEVLADDDDDEVKPKQELTHTESVQQLKNTFLQSKEMTVTKLIVQEQSELDELKSLNIMRQAISRFEPAADTNAPSNPMSSAVTETHFTTHTETQDGGGERTAQTIKKKTKKKTRKDGDKENMSVVHAINDESESLYNVNVKSLCRSFGDLTKMDIDQVQKIHVQRKAREKFSQISAIDSRLSSVVQRPLSLLVEWKKSSFNKFDAMAKKNALNSQSTEQNNMDGNCRKCGRAVFHMERIKAEKSIYHRNCFRCVECERQLLVDTFESHEGELYCKSHFKALFAPRAVDDEEEISTKKYEVIIRENQPKELPPDVVRASDKPDLGLSELHTLNVKERFQVFENINTDANQTELTSPVSLKRGPTILSKLAKFQAKGMDVGVTDESLNGIAVEESASEEEPEDGEDADLIRAKKVQKEKPFHFVQLQDVKSKWEQGGREQVKDERREERKQEIQTIRSRLFLGKQGKMKEAYQQAIMEAETSPTIRKETPVEAAEMRSIKEKWERGDLTGDDKVNRTEEDMTLFESGISKQSRSIFMEMDANAAKSPPPVTTPTSPIKVSTSVRSAREAYLARQANENTVRSTDYQDEVQVRTEDVQNKFNFFETYREPERSRKEFRMTPPREGQLKSETPEREVYKDPNVIRTDDYRDSDKVIAKATHTTSKMLNKFRQMEENLHRNEAQEGLKPLKRFTPPREPLRREESSEEEEEESEEEIEEYEERTTQDHSLMEAQKAARAKQLRAKFERWEEKEIRREQTQTSTYNVVVEQNGDEQSQLETTKSLRSKFESLRSDNSSGQKAGPRVKVNRFVGAELCLSCGEKVYPLEKISVHEQIYHRNCFRCKECHAVLRMDSYTFNQGLLYCTTHFKRLFITKGNYDTAFGLEQHKDKWNPIVAS